MRDPYNGIGKKLFCEFIKYIPKNSKDKFGLMCYYPLDNGHGSRNVPCSNDVDPKACNRGFTLIELMIVVAIIGTLSAIAAPNFLKYREKGRIAVVLTDIRIIEKSITLYVIDNNELPDSLNDLSISNIIDPWGNPYQYLRIDGGGQGKGHMRKDHFMVPVNTDYDLYSKGKDGMSAAPFTAANSQDDIVRTNNGGFVGLVSDY